MCEVGKITKIKGVEIEIDEFLRPGNLSIIRVIPWTNGEGYDIFIDDGSISITHSELQALNYLVLGLDVKPTEG